MSRSYSSILTVTAAAWVAGVVSASTLGAQSAYKPGSNSYRVDQSINAVQTMQGQSVESSATTLQLISLSLVEASPDLQFSLTVDSASTMLVGAPPEQQEMANAAMRELKGKRVTGTMSPQGRVSAAQASDSAPSSEQMVSSVRGFLPKLPAGGLKTGASWNDSTTSRFNNNGVDGTTTVITSHSVVGDTTVGGQPAWKISQKGTVRMAGSGVSQGAEISLDGEGTVDGHSFVSKSGIYLGGEQQLTQNMTITVPAAGMTIPMEQKVTTKVTRVGS